MKSRKDLVFFLPSLNLYSCFKNCFNPFVSCASQSLAWLQVVVNLLHAQLNWSPYLPFSEQVRPLGNLSLDSSCK